MKRPQIKKFTDINNFNMLLDVLIALFFRSFGAISAFILTLVVARQLGAKESGYYFLGYSIIFMLATFSRVGLSNTVIRYVGANPNYLISALLKSFFLSGFLSLIITILLYKNYNFIGISLNKPELGIVIKLMSISLLGITLSTLIANSLQAMHKTKSSIFLISIGVNILLIFFVISATIVDSMKLAGLFSLAVYINAFLSILFFVFLRPKKNKNRNLSWSKLLSSCLPLWVTTIMTQLVMWSGQFIAGIYESSDVIAQLAVAQRTAALISFILVSINFIFAPRFSEMYAKSEISELEVVAKWSVRLATFFALPVTLILILFPTTIMSLFGADFKAGSYYLVILAIGQFFNAAVGPVAFLLIMTGHENDMKKISLITGIFAIFSIWLLTYFFGGIGNSIGTALTVILQNILALSYVSHRLGFNFSPFASFNKNN